MFKRTNLKAWETANAYSFQWKDERSIGSNKIIPPLYIVDQSRTKKPHYIIYASLGSRVVTTMGHVSQLFTMLSICTRRIARAKNVDFVFSDMKA